MENTVWKFSFFIAILALISCNNKDEHSLGAFRIDIATVIPVGESAYSLLLDNGKRLWPAASDKKYIPSDNQRVFVNYTTLSKEKDGYDHYVKINDIWDILTKETILLTAMNKDSIGNDPVKVNAVWVGGDYLNIDFMFNYGAIRPHAINMVINPLKTTPSPPDAIELEFRHNAYGSTSTRLYEGFVCFDLKPFRVSVADSMAFSIVVKDWDKEKTYNVVYRYNQAALQNTIAETPIPVISSNEYY
ncbi:MAG: NigD-like protein [Bacteroidia bacterium]|nr:NigD-like protein [Bacteroidia bacterium]